MSVGIAGLLSCHVKGVVEVREASIYSIAFWFARFALGNLFLVFLYGIAANIFFTGGWVTELVVRKFWPVQADRFATLTYSLGVTFAVLLTVTPGIFAGAVGIFEVLRHRFGAISEPLTPPSSPL